MKCAPSEYDVYLYHQGTNFQCYRMLGAHLTKERDTLGVRFAVWAPHAREVKVVGDFNRWDGKEHGMTRVEGGIWHTFIPGLGEGDIYKYEITTWWGGKIQKADPCGFYAEAPPKSASVVYDLESYQWNDQDWQRQKAFGTSYNEPMVIYEVHLGSWKRKEDNRVLTYRELADELVDYVVEMGYTHIELLPITEYPFDGSWGYQVTGYFAPTSRYGEPRDLMYLVDRCHQRGIGVILDWIPGHFARDGHGLFEFDGKPLYENLNPMKSENADWGTRNFDLGKTQVQSFLVSNALYWLEVFHFDGIRVDAVASMLYLDYGKRQGQWIPNSHGGNESLEGIAFFKKLNEAVFARQPQALMVAEESTAWPLVSKPTYMGGLGFNYKWNMGWMNDMLSYMEKDPIYRKWHHNQITFSFMYAFSENYILPLSHDEVVHGKKSLLDKMPGDYWQKFANLRAFYGYMMAHPGKKLLFMGGEFGQFIEWKYDSSLDWHLLDYDKHQKMHHFVRELNWFYRKESTLWELDHDWRGFEWIDPHDYSQSIISFMRRGNSVDDVMIVVCNFTPEVHGGYRVGVPQPGEYREIFNSDNQAYGGSGQENRGGIIAQDAQWHGQPHSLEITVPPLATIYLKKVES
ncbi:1,4-alpha-glucan branching enzyme [Desulfitispora alkaliphila]